MTFEAAAPFPVYAHGDGIVVLLIVLQPLSCAAPGTQSPNVPSDSRCAETSPPELTHLNARIVLTAPPCVNVPSRRMSPSTWFPPENVPFGQLFDVSPATEIGFWKNQNPKSL